MKKNYLQNTFYLPTYWVNSNTFLNCTEVNALSNNITLSIITKNLKMLFKILPNFEVVDHTPHIFPKVDRIKFLRIASKSTQKLLKKRHKTPEK